MQKSVVMAIGLAAVSAWAGWNGAGVSGGTGDNKVNETGNWAGGVVDGDFSRITAEGTTALVLTNAIAFQEGAAKTVTGVSFVSNSTDIVFTSVVGIAVGQTVNGASIPYNTFLIALTDTNGTLARATTGLPSGSYTLARPALNFDFGVAGPTRATNVTVTFGSDVPGTTRALSLSGRLCQSQYALPTNRVVFSADVAVTCGNPTYITRESGTANTGGVVPSVTFDGPVSLGNYGAMTVPLYLDGGDLNLNGVVAGTNARINCCNSGYAGTVRFTNPGNTFSGGLTSSGGSQGNLVANSPTVLAATDSPSALGRQTYFGFNNIRYTFTGFSTRQVSDRAWNIGASGAFSSALINNGAAPIELTGTVYNNVNAYAVQFGGSYQHRAVPNVVSGVMTNGSQTLGVYVVGGIWRLTNPSNAFTGSVRAGSGNGATLQFTSLANSGVKSALGAGSILQFESAGSGNTAYMEYIGTNNVQSNRELRFTGNSSEGCNSALYVNGIGTLELTGMVTNALTPNSGGLGARGLFLGGTGTGKLSGRAALDDNISGSNTGRVSIYKVGSGSWTISGSNFNHRGVTVARSGTLTLDYTANDQIAAAAPGIVYTDGGTLRFVGRPAGATADTLATLKLGAEATQYRSSRLVVDANGGDGFTLACATLAGDGMAQKFELIDLANSAGNALTVESVGTRLSPANGGVLMNNALTPADGNGRATIILHTADGYGFPVLSGVSNGVLQRLSGQQTLPASGYVNASNYIMSAAETVTPSADVSFSTLTLDTAAGEPVLALGTRKLTTALAGRAILFCGTNSATVSGTGAAGHVSATSLWFHNYLASGATLNASFNLASDASGPHILWGGTGFTDYSGSGLGKNFHLAGSVFRMSKPQTLTFPGGGGIFVISCGGVFEVGADLNGAAEGDFAFTVGAPGSATTNVALYGDAGFSAAGADRVIAFSGGEKSLSWGSGHFLTFYDGTLDYGYALKLSSAYADATVEIRNPIDLNGNNLHGRIRTVEVADGSAAVDARLSGALGGNAALAKTGAGTLELTGSQSYDGPLMVMAGTLRLGAGNLVTNALAVQLRGGGLAAGSGTNTLGRLELYADSVIDVGDGTAALAFADSSAAAWGGTLAITGTLRPVTLRFGTDADGLSAAQLAVISNNGAEVVIDADGYLHRIPPATIFMVR